MINPFEIVDQKERAGINIITVKIVRRTPSGEGKWDVSSWHAILQIEGEVTDEKIRDELMAQGQYAL